MCNRKVCQGIFFVGNAFLLVLAAALIVFGIGYLNFTSENETLCPTISTMNRIIETLAVPLIISASLIFVTAVDGFIASIRDNSCMLITYATKMVIIGVFCLMVGTLLTTYIVKTVIICEPDFSRKFNNLRNTTNLQEKDSFLEKIEKLQTEYQCCGVHSSEDYTTITPYKDYGWLPLSCCDSSKLNNTPCTSKESWRVGCVKASMDRLDFVLGPVCLVSAFLIIYLAVQAGFVGLGKCPFATFHPLD